MFRTSAFFLAISAISSALFLPSLTNINQTLSTIDLSIASGTSPMRLLDTNYYVLIEECGDEINAINERLEQTKREALRGIQDAIFGVRSTYGFKSMFKESSAIMRVQEIYKAIYHHEAVLGLKPNPHEVKPPRFACVREESTQIYKNLNLGYDPWQRCLAAGSPRHNRVPAFYAEGTAYIFLCPAYFTQEDRPTQPHCPAVHENRFAGDPNIFYKKYQVYTLLYNLLRFYLGDKALDNNSDPREELDWNNCVFLNVMNSIRNPTNLVIYAAMIAQSCIESPDPPDYSSSRNSSQIESVPSEYASTNLWPLAMATETTSTQRTAAATLVLPGNGQQSSTADA